MAIEIFPGAVKFDFPEKLAKSIIKETKKSKLEWQESAVGSGSVLKHVRSSQTFGLERLEISSEIRDILYDCVKKYCNYYGISIYSDEGLDLLRYKDYDKYEYHVDDFGQKGRTVSCLIYLNPTEYEGGGTTFKHFNYTINPEKPALVLFPSNYSYLHAAEPVTSGIKYIVVTWMSDKPKDLLDHSENCTCGR